MRRFDDAPLRPATRDGVSASCVALPPGAWRTISAFLRERFHRIGADEWQARLQRGEVVDMHGREVAEDTPYEPHLKVYYYRCLPPEPQVPFEETVLFQDEHIVVADKPHFLPVTPSGRYLQQTLLVRLKRRLGIDTLSPAHRIDRDTAGLVLFTVKPAARGPYHAMFRTRQVLKHYDAIAPLSASLCLPLMHRSRLVEGDSFMTMREVPGEPNAFTHIELIDSRNGHGLYRLQPLSGKRHQLRVHMASLGVPIVGDGFYPKLLPEAAEPDPTRPLQLVARALAFTDPITGEARAFESRYRLSLPDVAE